MEVSTYGWTVAFLLESGLKRWHFPSFRNSSLILSSDCRIFMSLTDQSLSPAVEAVKIKDELGRT